MAKKSDNKKSADKKPRQAAVGTKSSRNSRRDPVALIEKTNEGRIDDLVPTRHTRMAVSPFTYYRGAAAVMAYDLAAEPMSDIVIQACGDCHILNCGAFATPERNVIIDINDFDETHPAPFEWDLKRLATSLVLACDSIGWNDSTAEKGVYHMMRSYQRDITEYAQMRLLEIWHTRLDFHKFINTSIDESRRKKRAKALAKETLKSSPEMLKRKLTEKTKQGWRFKEMLPLLFHPKDNDMNLAHKSFEAYLESLPSDRAQLLRHFQLSDLALKVVGTGSVGTYCAVVLLVGENDELLVLQVKEARASVLEPYLKESEFDNHGERVVVGQRLMQSASDMFLGWTRGIGAKKRDFYVRQLRDVKLSPNPAEWNKTGFYDLADVAGKIMAKTQAKSGRAAAIAEYIGKSDKFAKEMTKYALSYAEKTQSDYECFVEACESGELATEKSVVG